MVQISGRIASLVVKKRNGQQVPFFDIRIHSAIESAFKAHLGIPYESALDPDTSRKVDEVTQSVVHRCEEMSQESSHVFIEDIQNFVVEQLATSGFPAIAACYNDYRRAQELSRLETERLTILKREGKAVSFKPEKITIALGKAFAAHYGGPLSSEKRHAVLVLADQVVASLKAESPGLYTITIEHIQDVVEQILMAEGYHDVARKYIIYREHRRNSRDEEPPLEPSLEPQIEIDVINSEGRIIKLDIERLKLDIAEACHGLEDKVSVEMILGGTLKNCFNKMLLSQVREAIALAVKPLIEIEPAYSFVAGRVLLHQLYSEVAGKQVTLNEFTPDYIQHFKNSIHALVENDRLSPALLDFDLDLLGQSLSPGRDLKFQYMGLQTLYDRYFIHIEKRRMEAPQAFWMRVAMGLATAEKDDKNARAIEFYEVLSTFRFVSSTPTLFNAGTCHSQLSSCFLTTIGDDLDHIFKCVKDNALLSKWSGGLGNDWTPVRALGSYIKGTNGHSQGVIPFLKVANDTAVAVNQGGKRQGAVCAYLETWHLDIEEFLELRKNTGDDRRRTHDMHTSNWIPDLFMQRVLANGEWTLFSSHETPELHDLYGHAFKEKYEDYEKRARAGEIRQYKVVAAVQLWRKMLSMVFETGHPWITFKDPSNLRSPQSHVGVVHSSNLCTEILLNTSSAETAVCNLGSVNLVAHMSPAGLDSELIGRTVRTAIRMLDNVIDINYYPTVEAGDANCKHRPIGLGIMGFQDALHIKGISYASTEAVEFADESMEIISYHAILSSSELARERGSYSSYPGSKWSQGLLPLDTIALLRAERGGNLGMDSSSRLDWTPVRESIKKYGMRNSNTMAIAPTATIANITGVSQSIEPIYKHLFVKSNLSGEFTVVNPYLVEELKARGLWDAQMRDDLKYFDGCLQEITRLPQELKDRYPTAFEIDYAWIIECASRRQKWIDMGQSLNLYMAEPKGKKLHDMYFMAWETGLKTTYYLRSLGATRIEKSTLDANKYGDPLGRNSKVEKPVIDAAQCRIDNPDDCEACQ